MATKKTYSKEFKEEAVRLAQKNGNQTQTAQDLGIHQSVLRRWKKELEADGQQAFPGKGYTKDEDLANYKSTAKGDCGSIKKRQ